jgi:cytidyltransferase-like protein
MINIISGVVVKWKQLWRTIWFPTVNLELKNSDLTDSTFKINIIIDWVVFSGAWVYRKNIELFEWHIFNFNKEIYWKKIEIIILEKIRNNIKINSQEELKIQIKKDITKIKKINYNVLTFGSFDVVHKWHSYYLKEAKKYWNKLITIIATDKNIEKIKNFKPQNNQQKRLEEVKKLGISDKVIIWNENNKLKWLKIFKPKVICLGYDQWGYTNLKKYLKDNNLNIEIIRIKSYKPEIYKSSILKNKLW